MSFILLGILNSQALAGGGATHELIETIDVTSGVSSVTFSSIPQDYEMLELTYNIDNATFTDIVAYHNAGNVTDSLSYKAYATNGPQGSTRLASYCIIGNNDSDTDSTGIGRMIFHKYNSTSLETSFFGVYSRPDRESGWVAGTYNDTTAMTSLQVTVLAGSINAGSRVSLFGIRGEE